MIVGAVFVQKSTNVHTERVTTGREVNGGPHSNHFSSLERPTVEPKLVACGQKPVKFARDEDQIRGPLVALTIFSKEKRVERE